MRQDAVYEERIVAFIDVLGFRDLIRQSETDQALANDVLGVLNYVKGIRDENREGPSPECDVVGRQVTVFSDSVVISYPTYCPSCLYYSIYDAVHLQLAMFYNGLPVRGGISLGVMYHQQDIAFGPALISAYDLEKNWAVNPRIVITEDTIKTGLTKSPHNIPKYERSHVLELLRKDSDGLYYVDFLNQRSETDDDGKYIDLLQRVRSMITNGLLSEETPVRQKYEWLKHKYNAAVTLQGSQEHAPLV